MTKITGISGPELFTIRSGSQVERVATELPEGFVIDGQPYVYTALRVGFELDFKPFPASFGEGITMIIDPTEPFAYFNFDIPALGSKGLKLAYSHDGHLTYTPLQQPDLWEKTSFQGHMFAEVSGIPIAGFLNGTGALTIDLDANDDGNKLDFKPSDLLNFAFSSSPMDLVTPKDSLGLSDFALGFNGKVDMDMSKLGLDKLGRVMTFTAGEASAIFDGVQQGFFFHGSGKNPFKGSILANIPFVGPDFNFKFDGAMTGVTNVGKFNVPTNYRLAADGMYKKDGFKAHADFLFSSHASEPWLSLNGKMKTAGLTSKFAGTVTRNGTVNVVATQRVSGSERIGIKGFSIKVRTVSEFTFRFTGDVDSGISLEMTQSVSLSAKKRFRKVGKFKISGTFVLSLSISLDGKLNGNVAVSASGDIRVETPFGNKRISGTIKAEVSDSGLRIRFPFLGIGWQKILKWQHADLPEARHFA